MGVGFEPCPVQKLVETRCLCAMFARRHAAAARGGVESHRADVLMGSVDQAGSAAPAPE